MKRILLILGISSSLFILAQKQQAGSVGELLKNEISEKTLSLGQKISTDDKSAYPVYNWVYGGGNAEVFLRIPEGGHFEVQVGNQRISSPSGRFRFFDLADGVMPVSIYHAGHLIYLSHIHTRSGMRVVLDYFSNMGIYQLGIFPATGGDSIWNDPYRVRPNLPKGYPSPHGDFPLNSHYSRGIMQPERFASFMDILSRRSFDDDKLRSLRAQARRVYFTSQQVAEIIRVFSFDERRLEVAKELYERTVDPENYFVVIESIEFDSTRRKLEDFITHSSRR